MPSASAKVEKVAPSETTDSAKLCLQLVEKRQRNLEKRKMKLESYRCDVEKGKELNEDQKLAVAKYEIVENLWDNTKDLCKQMNQIIVESARQQKKQAKKEQIERQRNEIQRLQQAFIYRHTLSCFQNEDVRSDFLNGENGAVQLTSEQLSQIDQLYKLIGPGLPNEQADITNHFHALAENHIFLVEGRNKEIAGTTYKVFKELLQKIKESGYFSKPSEPIEDATSSDGMPEDGIVAEKLADSYAPSPPVEVNNVESPTEQFAADEPKEISSDSPTHETKPVEQAPAVQNGPLQEVLVPQSSFNFLQESQIDLDAPHMDPAVVAVHQMAPPPNVNFAMTAYPVSPSAEDVSQSMVNGNEAHEPTSPSAMNQVPVVPTGVAARTVAPVLTSVQHGGQPDFDPSHPIPTQTFTNQSFAVMQNMIMPQGYVPVTMHHGPIPAHVAPIAVVPAPTASPATAVPIHVPMVPVQDNVIPVVLETKADMDETQLNGNNESTDGDPSLNGSAVEKGNENNGFPHYRGGYRGRGRGRGNNGYFRGRANYHNGRGGYQNHYYQDRNNGYNGNFRRGNNRGGPRGNGNNRGRGNYNRTQAPQQQQQQPPQTQQ